MTSDINDPNDAQTIDDSLSLNINISSKVYKDVDKNVKNNLIIPPINGEIKITTKPDQQEIKEVKETKVSPEPVQKEEPKITPEPKQQKELPPIEEIYAEWIQEHSVRHMVTIDMIKSEIDFANVLYCSVDRPERDDMVLAYVNSVLINKYYFGLRIPEPYIVEDGLLYYVKTIEREDEDDLKINILISKAFVIKSIGQINDEGELNHVDFVELAWFDINGNVVTGLYQQNWLLDQTLQREHLKPFNILGTKRAEFIDYCSKLLTTNCIPKKKVTNVGGWKENFTQFVTSDETYGSKEKYLVIQNRMMENIHKHGTFDNWIEGTYQLLNDEVFAFVTYTGVCGLLQNPLGISNFEIINSAKSSTGKTTGGKAKSSMFGHAFNMIVTPNASKLGIQNAIGAYNDISCHLDEITKTDLDMIEKFIYDHSSSKPREVGAKAGGNKDNRDKTFSNNVYITTEEVIFGANAKTGQLARSIPILRSPKINYEGVKKFESLVCTKNRICRNYGHALEPLVLKIIELYQNGKLANRYNEIIDELRIENVNHSPVIDRLIEYYAGIALGGEIFNEAIVNHPENKGRIQALNPVEIAKNFMKDYMEEEPDKPEGERAMEVFIDWYLSNKYHFNEPEPRVYTSSDGTTTYSDQRIKFYGYDQGETIDVFSTIVKEELEKHGFAYQSIVRDWKENGYLITRNDKKRGEVAVVPKKHTVGNKNILGEQQFTAIRIIKSKVQHLLNEGESTEKAENKINAVIADFCKDKLVIGGAIIESTLKEIHNSYTEWCSQNKVIPLGLLQFFTAFTNLHKNVGYSQTDVNDMNTIFFSSVGLKETNCTKHEPIKIAKLNLTDDEVEA